MGGTTVYKIGLSTHQIAEAIREELLRAELYNLWLKVISVVERPEYSNTFELFMRFTK